MVQRNLWLDYKKDYFCPSQPAFVSKHIQLFFFPSPLLCVLAFQNRVWQRKWGSNILFFVLKLLRSADCVFIGCELQDVVSGSSLSADPTSGLFWEILSRADCKMQG